MERVHGLLYGWCMAGVAGLDNAWFAHHFLHSVPLLCLLVPLQLAVAGNASGKVLAHYSEGPLFRRYAIQLGLGLGLWLGVGLMLG